MKNLESFLNQNFNIKKIDIEKKAYGKSLLNFD